MSGVDGLRAAVAAAPGDWLARSALADYLEEQGAAEAATVRAEAERLRQLADRLDAEGEGGLSPKRIQDE